MLTEDSPNHVGAIERDPADHVSRLFGVWSCIGMMVLFGLGLVAFARFLPPPAPDLTADQITSVYLSNLVPIRIGTVLMTVSFPLLIPFAALVASELRSREGTFPTLTYIQVGSASAVAGLAALIPLVWAIAAFRPGETDPHITQAWNDFGWFLFLFMWPPASMWAVAVGIAILRDADSKPVFPRWVGYLSFWMAFLLFPGGLIVFVKKGVFAWNGLISLWIPLVVFFVWLVALLIFEIAHLGIKVGKRRRVREDSIAVDRGQK
ncbi:hypothetical protein ABIA39_009017 [Nocardia sp. GAS34]|uniref:hypothetical protein n=1 Tax=unclassified Nocardia TaxID=2637762 RepID=UPI003D1E1E0C